MNDFLVSVCMITYNHENYIEEALNSILNQVINFNVEIIIYDDFSIDNTRSIINNYASKHHKNFHFKVFFNKENIGVAKNFKLALEACTGKYVALCEGDDAWGDKNKLSKQLYYLESNPNFIASFHDSSFYNEKSELVYGKVLKQNAKKNLGFKDFISGNYTIPTQSVFFRKEFLMLPKEFIQIPNPDILLFSFLSSLGGFYYQKEIGDSYYRLHSGGYFSTQSRYKQTQGNKETFKKLFILFPNEIDLLKSILIKIFSCFIFSIKEKNISSALFHFFEYLSFKTFCLKILRFRIWYPFKVVKIYLLNR
jgi:glycosyltransferase involved in cell wall biosynthesis